MPDLGLGPADEAGRLAEAYIETGNYQRAREVLGRLLSQNPNDPSLLTQYARAEYMLENYPSAARSAYAGLCADPLNESAMRIYALSLDGLGRDYEARWMAWRGVLAHPNEPLQHRLYARLLHSSRQHASALQAVDVALRLDPMSIEALTLRGSILHDLGRIDESDASYRQVLTLSPGDAEALNNLAVNRLQRFRFGKALRGFLGAGLLAVKVALDFLVSIVFARPFSLLFYFSPIDNPFLESLGVRLTQWREGYAELSMSIDPSKLNRQGVLAPVVRDLDEECFEGILAAGCHLRRNR